MWNFPLLAHLTWSMGVEAIEMAIFSVHRTGSNPKIRRNKIWGGQNGGILVYNSGMFNLSSFSQC